MLQTFLSFGGVSLHVCSLYMWLCLKIGGLATIDGYKRIGAMMMNQGEPETNSFCVEAFSYHHSRASLYPNNNSSTIFSWPNLPSVESLLRPYWDDFHPSRSVTPQAKQLQFLIEGASDARRKLADLLKFLKFL